MNPALHQLAGQFSLLQLHVTVQLQQAVKLPAFKGSMLHGWFGHALKQTDEQAYEICYGTHAPQQPKPYVICPSFDLKTDYQAGELLSFEIKLFGQATALSERLLQVLAQGQRLGFTQKQVPFTLVSVASFTPQGLRSGLHICTLGDFLMPQLLLSQSSSDIALQFHTPVRVKDQGQVCKQPPATLDFWLKQILRRVKQLAEFWVTDDQTLLEGIYALQAMPMAIEGQNLGFYEDWQRYSQRQQQLISFGGFKGQVSFHGQAGAFAEVIALLKIGELLHVGGKTTFGLGRYQLLG